MPTTNQNNTDYVSAGKPKIGGAIFMAPLGTALPTNATSELPAAYQCLGYVSEDGLAENITRTTTDIREWGGGVVDSEQTDFSDSYSYKLIEATNPVVLKHTFGEESVSGDLTAGLKLKVGPASNPDPCVLVVDTIHKGYLKRQVLPNAQAAEIGEIAYKRDEAVGYAITTKAMLDADGYTHYEYMVAAPAAANAGS